MNIRRHWKKICLAMTALLWASCNEDNGTAPVVNPQEKDSSASSSSEKASVDTVASSNSAEEVKYGYKVYSDTNITCKRTTYTKQEMVFNYSVMQSFPQDVSVDGYICTNGDSVSKDVYTAKSGILYTSSEYDKLFGPCVEHGGRVETLSVDPNCTKCEFKDDEDAEYYLKDKYYDVLSPYYKEITGSEGSFSEEKKNCFWSFYLDVEPVALYGAYFPSSSSVTPVTVEKITCADSTTINEEAYNAALAKRDSIVEHYERIYQSDLYCDNVHYQARLDSCNAIDSTGTKIENVALDSTQVNLLDQDTKHYYDEECKEQQ